MAPVGDERTGPTAPAPLTRRELLEQRRRAETQAGPEAGPSPDAQPEPQPTAPPEPGPPPAPATTNGDIGSEIDSDIDGHIDSEIDLTQAEPRTRRESMAQERRQGGHDSPHRSKRAAATAGAAMVLVAAAVGGHGLGLAVPTPRSAAADLSASSGRAERSTATTTANQELDVRAGSAFAALNLGTASPFPARLRAVSRSRLRPVLAGCDGRVSDYTYANGQMPATELCALTFAPGHHLRADAAVALARLNIAYRAKFGHNLCLTDSYRSLASQESLAARKPGLAARPGTSEHGLGLAVDFCDGVQVYRSAHYDWMRANAPTFGWQNPAWAVPPSSREEPWHWEYVVGERKGPAA